MNNKEFFKKYLITTFLVFILFFSTFIILNHLAYQKYKETFNQKINNVFALIKEEYPSISTNEFMKMLQDEDINFAEEYGYDLKTDDLISSNEKTYQRYLIYDALCFFSLALSLFIIFILYNHHKDKELDKIIKLIENINHKNYELNIDDISEDKLSILKHEIYKTTIMLKEQAENSMQDKMSLKKALQDISHQLKTPLTSIMISLDNLLESPDMDEETRESFLLQIKKEAININLLVASILKLSRFEVNAITFSPKKVLFSKIMTKAKQNLWALSDLKNVTIKVIGDHDNYLLCDEYWETEALTNILKNAIEYSPEGTEVLVAVQKTKTYLKVVIKDFGKGMDSEDTKKIFARFYKGKNASLDSVGIGLALAKMIIEKDGGLISVSSKEGEGTTFTIKYFTI